MRIKPRYPILLPLLFILVFSFFLNFFIEDKTALKKVDASLLRPSLSLPIVIYHHILTRANMPDSLYISPQELEGDFLYLKVQGFHSIHMKDLIAYVDSNQALPEKPILLCFDDGYLNNYVYAFPLLQKYNMKMVLSLIGKSTDEFSKKTDINLDYSYANWDQIKEMIESGYVEIQNHSYNLHSLKGSRFGASINPGEDFLAYELELSRDIGNFQKYLTQKTASTPTTFCYPFGYISPESDGILKNMGFRASLSSNGGINRIEQNPDALFSLKRNNRPHNISSEAFFKGIYRVK